LSLNRQLGDVDKAEMVDTQ